ncbi:hypothetical protein ACHAXR_013008 [Thalassiosira sp. AJA248-18]
MSMCAACGKGGDGLKACTTCKLVKYCNVTCQKVHRPNHKKECRKRAAEIFDESLFETPPPNEDCPICFLRLPLNPSDAQYRVCCGKILCFACVHADAIARQSAEQICPFCRTPGATSHDEEIARIKGRIEVGDAVAMYLLGCGYQNGKGVRQDSNKALELWRRAAKRGSAESHCNIGHGYFHGIGVEKDAKKAKSHWELAAMGGDVAARYTLGVAEGSTGNINRAMKHFMISAELGCDDSLKEIQNGFLEGHVTKDEFEKAMYAHKKSTDEMQSDQRDTLKRWINDQRDSVEGINVA